MGFQEIVKCDGCGKEHVNTEDDRGEVPIEWFDISLRQKRRGVHYVSQHHAVACSAECLQKAVTALVATVT